MSLIAVHNTSVDRSFIPNRFGSVSQSHERAIAQIARAHLGNKPHYKVLDLGVGCGAFLQALKPYLPSAEFTGIDVSSSMLEAAKETLPRITTIETSATEASNYLPHHSQDLVLAHFTNAYIPINTLFSQANLLTRANGHFSLVTTTYDAFPNTQRQLANFVAQDAVLSRIVGHYYKGIVKNTTVAPSEEELIHLLQRHEFQIVEHQRLHIPIVLNNIEELALFGLEGTWFLNSLAIRVLPRNFLVTRLKRLFKKIFTFPYEDTHIIDVVLAKK